MEQKVMPCPFCGSHNIEYSVKTMGRREKRFHVAMYCKDCNCYGKRTIVNVTDEEYFRSGVVRNPKYKQIAIDAWNTRNYDVLIKKLDGMQYLNCYESAALGYNKALLDVKCFIKEDL